MTTASPPFSVRLRYATVKTGRLEESIRFYEEVLGLPRTKTTDDFVQLDAGGAELCLDVDGGGEHQPRLISAVDDVDALAGALVDHGVDLVDRDEEGRWLMVRDPDGNEIVFER